ncbi:MAG: hypothetical protein K0R44_3498 [Thermomicrobiales bacterium]|nr:hypothetical protein [Thermomicrobiales bacterium]
MRLHQAGGVVDGGVQATEDPAIGQGGLAAGSCRAVLTDDDLRVTNWAQGEASGVPELVSEVARILDLLDVQPQIGPRAALGDQGKP